MTEHDSLVAGCHAAVALALAELDAGNTSGARELLLPIERRLRASSALLSGGALPDLPKENRMTIRHHPKQRRENPALT